MTNFAGGWEKQASFWRSLQILWIFTSLFDLAPLFYDIRRWEALSMLDDLSIFHEEAFPTMEW